MSASAIPAVSSAVESRLEVLQGSTLSGVTVSRGAPEVPDDELIALDTATASRSYASLGTQALDEDIRLGFVVGVVKLGGSYEEAETRAFELMDIVEQELRGDLSLGNAWLFGRLTNIERTYLPVDKGRAVQITFVIEGKARI